MGRMPFHARDAAIASAGRAESRKQISPLTAGNRGESAFTTSPKPALLMLPFTAAAPKNCAWVQDVESLHSKLERFCLRDMETLLQSHVEVGSTQGHRKSGVAHCPTGQGKDRYLIGKAPC
jgi:hypothetical protein